VYDALYAYCQEMVRRGKPNGQFRWKKVDDTCLCPISGKVARRGARERKFRIHLRQALGTTSKFSPCSIYGSSLGVRRTLLM